MPHSNLGWEQRVVLTRPLPLQILEPGDERFRLRRCLRRARCNLGAQELQEADLPLFHVRIPAQLAAPAGGWKPRRQPLMVPVGETLLEGVAEKLVAVVDRTHLKYAYHAQLNRLRGCQFPASKCACVSWV